VHRLAENTKRRIRSVITTTLGMMCLGVLYAFVFRGGDPRVILNGIVIALIVGTVSSIGEMYWFQSRARRWRFWMLLTIRSAFYVALISVAVLFTVVVHLALKESSTIQEVLSSPYFLNFLAQGEFTRVMVYAVIGTLAVNFTRQVNVLIGQNALLYFITSKYHTPLEEERIFMFLDLKSSTHIAETLGHTVYHRFLNDFFHDITPAILESRGEVYQYVGDEVVVTWPGKIGLKYGNCLNCYFSARAAIELSRGRYEREYKTVPNFKAGYHIGPVTVAEIGEVRKQIVFHGDTVNTAARIRSECTKVQKDLLLSETLVKKLYTGDLFTYDSVGDIMLSGKSEPMELFTVREAG
jgi:adenylate cyclase